MKILLKLISSCILLILFSCSTYNNYSEANILLNKQTPVFNKTVNQAVYRGSIEIFDKYYSGIFAFKKLNKTNYRLVLMSEVGMTLIDISFNDSEYKINHCIEPLNKKSLLNLLKTDFLLLANFPSKIKYKKINKDNFIIIKDYNNRHFYSFDNNQLIEIEAKSIFNKVTISFGDVQNGLAKNINIQHRPLKLSIDLKRIK